MWLSKTLGLRAPSLRVAQLKSAASAVRFSRSAALAFVVGLGVLLAVFIADRLYPLNLPEHNALFARTLVDESGRPLRAFADDKGVWRYPINQEQVSPRYVEALLAYEDRWFWQHSGINPVALLRALVLNLKGNRIISGGSTLSMQVARLLHPHARTLPGKLQQLLRTVQLEWHLDKNQILNLYLNIAPFGGTIEGVQAASFTYLNKSAADLTDAEAALLAVLPQSPTRLRPDLHPEQAAQARNKVLDRLESFGIWPAERVLAAKIETVYAVRAKQEHVAPLLARRLLSQSDGQQAIATTLDGNLQRGLEDYLANTIAHFPAQTSAAILVVDNHSSAVKAYLGSANFADASRFGHVDMITAIRSPGSTLKPFLFAKAIDAGLIHAESLLADVPRSWGDYRPSNFNSGFMGPVSASEALQRSLNMPFVELLDRYGAKRFSAELESAGLHLVTPGNQPNLALILGGTGASLEQLVRTYSAFANEGQVRPLIYLKTELNKPTQLIEKNNVASARHLMTPQSAWITQRILADIQRPGALNTLAQTQHQQTLAWKTGTSYGFRDSWAIGVNRDYSIGVWVGRPDGTALPGHSGRETAGPILFAVADYLRIDNAAISKPTGVTEVDICWPLGTAKQLQQISNQTRDENFTHTNHCHQSRTAWIANNAIPPTWHKADSDNWQPNPFVFWTQKKSSTQDSSATCTEESDAQSTAVSVALWPKVLEPWLARHYTRAVQIPNSSNNCASLSETELDPNNNANLNLTLNLNNSASSLKITGISNGNIYSPASNSAQRPNVQLATLGGMGQRHWYFNGVRRYSLDAAQIVTHTLVTPGPVQIVVIDDAGNVDQVNVIVL